MPILKTNGLLSKNVQKSPGTAEVGLGGAWLQHLALQKTAFTSAKASEKNVPLANNDIGHGGRSDAQFKLQERRPRPAAHYFMHIMILDCPPVQTTFSTLLKRRSTSSCSWRRTEIACPVPTKMRRR